MTQNTTEPDVPPSRSNRIIAILAFSGIVVSLMQTFVIPLLPELPALLGASVGDTSWAVTATLLASAVAVPVVGRLGDMFGKRRMLLLSLVLLTAGSVVAALSTNLASFITGRAIQGLAAGVIPLGISIMRDELPKAKLASAMALMSASLGIGGALGLPAAALLADHADWHVLFWVASGAGLLCLLLVAAIVPESGVKSGGKFDPVGAIGLSAGLLALLLAVSKGADWGWTDPLTLSLGIGAVVVLLAWGAYELRVPQPLVDLRTTARRQVLLTDLASVVFGFAMLAMSLVLPQLLQLPEATGVGFGQSMLTVGLVMMPSGLVMMAMSPVSARITNAKGPKTTLMAGAVIVAVAYGLGAFLMAEIWQLVLVATLMGAGMGLAYGAMPALIMDATPVHETAAANSLNTLMRSIGTSVSSAIAGVVLAHVTVDFAGTAVPSKDAFQIIFLIAAFASVAALAIAAFLPKRAVEAADAEPELARAAA
jgi:EmrB/QacA subfamily drug resistance transporter